MSIDVFISVGKSSKPEYEKFISEIEQFLRNHGLNPRVVGRTDFSIIQPLKFTEKVMSECSDTIVIAFENIHVEQGYEKRGSNLEKPVLNICIPSVWNQIEPAMAYILGHPLLVIIENGIRSEGLLESGHDWYVQWVEIDILTLQKAEFLGVFTDWKNRVEKYKLAGNKISSSNIISVDPKELTVAQIISSLKAAQLWAIIGAVIASMITLAGISYKLGNLKSAPAKTSTAIESSYYASRSSTNKNV
jgi:hypothetical protein